MIHTQAPDHPARRVMAHAWPKLATLALLAACTGTWGSARAAVMISQVYGGGGNSGAPLAQDFVELHNSGSSPIDITGWSLQYTSATGTSWGNQKVPLTGAIPAGGYYLVQLASGGANGIALPLADAIGNVNMSATRGKLLLARSDVSQSGSCPLGMGDVVDLVGYGSTANCAEGVAAAAPSNNQALLRRTQADGCQDSGDNAADFVAGTPNPRNSASAPQPCAAEAGPPDPATPAEIWAVQGAGDRSPMEGQRVVTSGVVTRINSNGFFMQSLIGDGDPATSDGLFVFTGNSRPADVAVGNWVEVTGTVTEFAVGSGSQALARPVTELTGVDSVVLRGSGYSLEPTVLRLPEAVDGELERVEGMLVRIEGPLTVQQNFFLGRYGQLTLAAGGRLPTPTNVHRPGPLAQAQADLNARSRILLDDGASTQNPNPVPYLDSDGLPRAGDQTDSVTGVIDYGLATNNSAGLSDYRLHPTQVPSFTSVNRRCAAPEEVGGNVRVASFNVLNYFTAFTDGTGSASGCSLGDSTRPANCRGASNAAEFARQRAKIVEAMVAIRADVFGLMEIQNNGNEAVQDLADALNARLGQDDYAVTPLPASTGSDAIRVAMLYRPSRLSLPTEPVTDTDAVHNRPPLAQTFALANGERFTVVVNHFKSKGSCPSATDADAAGNTDAGDGQGCWNALRVQQAERLALWLAGMRSTQGTADGLVIGDLNAYGQEDPIVRLASAGYADQVARFKPDAWSYVFDGASGRLDHGLASAGMAARVNKALYWPINADEAALLDYNLEFKAPDNTCGAGGSGPCPDDPFTANPFRSSDHDPLIIGLEVFREVVGTTGRDDLIGTAGDDRFVAGPGADRLTGGLGGDRFVYRSMRDAGDTITDFEPGLDQVDLRALLASLGIAADRALADGQVSLRPARGGTGLWIDRDGASGRLRPSLLLVLTGLSTAQVNPDRDLILD